MTWEWDYLIKILVALICGGILGAEREYTGKAAGFRTFTMVALGSCIFSIISLDVSQVAILKFNNELLRMDPGRIAAQVVVGIGFIGMGLIILQENKIKGLTTAAGLWFVAALGMAAGFGFYFLAILGTVSALIVLVGFRVLERHLDKRAEIARQKRVNDERND